MLLATAVAKNPWMRVSWVVVWSGRLPEKVQGYFS